MIHGSELDSKTFGVAIGRLVIGTLDELDPALQQAAGQNYDMVFLRVPDDDSPFIRELARREIAPMETLVTSTLTEAPRVTAATDLVIEHHPTLANDVDLAALTEITAATEWISHWHTDPRLDREKARSLFVTWARNDATGRAQRTIVARRGTAIVGYITVLVRDGVAVIDLIAVSPSATGGGIGSQLLASFCAWVHAEGLGARVGTQATNRVLGLYRRFGFTPTDRQLTYHLWRETFGGAAR